MHERKPTARRVGLAVILVAAAALGACSHSATAVHSIPVHLQGWPLSSGSKSLGTQCGPYVRAAQFGKNMSQDIAPRTFAADVANFYVCAPVTPFAGTYRAIAVPASLRGVLAKVLGEPDRPFSNHICLASVVMPIGGFPEVIARSLDGRYWLTRVPLGACAHRNARAQALIAQVLATTTAQ